MLIRNIKSGDTEALIALWKSALPYLCIDKKIFLNKIWLEPNFSSDGFFIAEENGRIVGFINAVFRRMPIVFGGEDESNMGWIAGFVVDKDYLHIGEELLSRAEEYLLSHGKTTVSTGFYPTYFTQGVDEELTPEYKRFFENRGYSCSVSKAKSLDLTSYIESERVALKREKLISEGFYIGNLTDEYLDKLLTLDNDFLNASWLFEFKNRIADNDFSRVKIAAFGGKVIGAVVLSDALSNAERFGPFGVSNEFQGMGIGSVLLADTLSEMKSRGLKSAWMQWCSLDPAANALYDKVGFVDTHSYCEYEKKLG